MKKQLFLLIALFSVNQSYAFGLRDIIGSALATVNWQSSTNSTADAQYANVINAIDAIATLDRSIIYLKDANKSLNQMEYKKALFYSLASAAEMFSYGIRAGIERNPLLYSAH